MSEERAQRADWYKSTRKTFDYDAKRTVRALRLLLAGSWSPLTRYRRLSRDLLPVGSIATDIFQQLDRFQLCKSRRRQDSKRWRVRRFESQDGWMNHFCGQVLPGTWTQRKLIRQRFLKPDFDCLELLQLFTPCPLRPTLSLCHRKMVRSRRELSDCQKRKELENA